MKAVINRLARGALLSGASLAALVGGQVSAQTASGNVDNSPEPVEASEVIVVVGVRQSVLKAIDQKRVAIGFVDSISAEDLGKFPDLNISESLQRVPGVTLFRNNTGDGQSINLRGLGSEFTRVEINGLTGTNNGTSGRFGGDSGSVGGGFNFEILASELFSNVTVKKSPAAKDVEGGLAGLLQLSTPRAFDRKGFKLSASAQAQVSETAETTGPRLALVMSQNWDNKFGITASIAYSDASFKSDSNGGISSRPLSAAGTPALRATTTAQQLAALVPQTINYQVDVEDRKTLGLTGGLQYRPNDVFEFTLDGIYATISSDRFFTRADAPPESGIVALANPVINDGVLTSGTLSTIQQRIATNDLSGEEEFGQLSAKLNITLNDSWRITPTLGYSKRTTDRTGQLLSFARGNPATGQPARFDVSYQIERPFIRFTTPGTDYSGNANPREFYINVFLLRPTLDRDEEISTKLDVTRYFEDKFFKQIDFGGRYSVREIDRKSFEARVQSATATTDLRTLPTLADALVVNPFDISGAPASFPNTIMTADPRRILALYLPNGFDASRYFEPTVGPLDSVNINGAAINGAVLRVIQSASASRSFKGEEKTLALYAQADIELGNLAVNLGARYVDTTQVSSGFSVGNNISVPVSVENKYSEFLPSITGRYTLSDTMIVRGAYSKTLSRPTLFDLRVAESFGGIDQSGGSGSSGNPRLQPFLSDNLDLGFEWYFAKEGLVALNLFRKSVDGLIVSGTVTQDRTFESQVTRLPVTAPIIFRVPVNGDKADIEGLELLAQSRFTFLPGALSNFGGILNLTLTNSDAAFEEGDNAALSNGLPGLSKTSYNAILYYDDGKLDARLAYAWRERFTSNLAASFGVPDFQQDFGQLDFSANYALSDRLSLQFQGLNLTKEQLEVVSISNIPNTTTQLDRRWFVGARYSF